MKRPLVARAPTDAQLAALEAETKPAPRERPLIVRAEEVRGLLDGTVTQLWRPVSVPSPMVGVKLWTPTDTTRLAHVSDACWALLRSHHDAMPVRSPFGAPGCRLWCRETWAPRVDDEEAAWRWNIDPYKGPKPHVFYLADGARPDLWIHCWRSPVSMPRWACRLVLPVERIEARRVSTATNADAEAAGFRGRVFSARDELLGSWEERYPGADWAWVATVRRIDAGTAVR